jgi:hypothetical protein
VLLFEYLAIKELNKPLHDDVSDKHELQHGLDGYVGCTDIQCLNNIRELNKPLFEDT